MKCGRCDGCGQIANCPTGEPWTAWENLPPGSNVAVRIGIVKPIACPACGGSGIATLVDAEELEAVRVVVRDVCAELGGARDKFPAFNSAHEGWAVLAEEFSELWDEVKARDQDPRAMRAEAVQVAAMAIRFILDVCDK